MMEQKIVNILQDQYLENMGWLKRDFNLLRCAVLTVQNLFNILGSDLKIIAVFDSQFEKDPYGGHPRMPQMVLSLSAF
jgi:hypothetical protein